MTQHVHCFIVIPTTSTVMHSSTEKENNLNTDKIEHTYEN